MIERLGHQLVWENTIWYVYSWYVKTNEKDGENKSTGYKSIRAPLSSSPKKNIIKERREITFTHINTCSPRLSDLSLFQAWGNFKEKQITTNEGTNLVEKWTTDAFDYLVLTNSNTFLSIRFNRLNCEVNQSWPKETKPHSKMTQRDF